MQLPSLLFCQIAKWCKMLQVIHCTSSSPTWRYKKEKGNPLSCLPAQKLAQPATPMYKGISEELMANGFYFMLLVSCWPKQHNQSNTHWLFLLLGFFQWLHYHVDTGWMREQSLGAVCLGNIKCNGILHHKGIIKRQADEQKWTLWNWAREGRRIQVFLVCQFWTGSDSYNTIFLKSILHIISCVLVTLLPFSQESGPWPTTTWWFIMFCRKVGLVNPDTQWSKQGIPNGNMKNTLLKSILISNPTTVYCKVFSSNNKTSDFLLMTPLL